MIIYFFFVETAGRTIEELDEAFSSKNPVNASLQRRSGTTIEQTKDISG